MKRILTLAVFILFCTALPAQILITEIMYNPPESNIDSLEYLEIYNAGDALDVTGYRIEGVDFNFPSMTMANGEFLIVAINPSAFENIFGMSALPFGGALSNGGEDVSIRDENDNIIHEVVFDNSSPWPGSDEGAAGEGSSIVLCDIDNPSAAESWKASGVGTGIVINSREVKGSPGEIDDIGCEGGPSGIIVTTTGLSFTPKDITINVGETITFTNGGGSHNANGSLDVFPDNPEGFTSGNVSSDAWEYPHIFNIAGVYDYQCDLHAGAGMVGTVTVLALPDNSDLRITEIMYNAGIVPDTLEYIEVYNAGTTAVSLEGYILSASSINSTLGAGLIPAGEYFVFCKNMNAFTLAYGSMTNVMEWGDGVLSNEGDNITLANTSGTVILDQTYDDDAPWPLEADGFGSSLILCDPIGEFALENIKANTEPVVEFLGLSLLASPGSTNYCSYSVGDATINDSEGVPIIQNQNVILNGTVYGINLNSSGLQFTLIDEFGDGIGAFSGNDDFGYTLSEGDELTVLGSIDHFNGLLQIYLDTLRMDGVGSLENPTIVTNISEDTESQLVTIENVSVVNPVDWNNSTFGFNVEMTNGLETFLVRIDNDVTDIIPLNYPTGTFSITGIGGQYDTNAPFDEGYQLLPRYMSDIDPFIPFVNEYPPSSIDAVTGNDSEGNATSVGNLVTLEGTVYGINFRPSGLHFVLIDDAGDGITVFNGTGDKDYTVSEGDRLEVKGTIDQFNGLTEIIPDTIKILGTNALIDPTLITSLDESTESQFIQFAEASLSFVDETQWLGDGTSFTVEVTDGTNNFTILIDNDSELSTYVLPMSDQLSVRGLGSQRDISAPFDEGYRIMPRYISDFMFVVGNEEIDLSTEFDLVPNPASTSVQILSDKNILSVELYSVDGKKVNKSYSRILDISNFENGQYFVRIQSSDGIAIKKLSIQR